MNILAVLLLLGLAVVMEAWSKPVSTPASVSDSSTRGPKDIIQPRIPGDDDDDNDDDDDDDDLIPADIESRPGVNSTAGETSAGGVQTSPAEVSV